MPIDGPSSANLTRLAFPSYIEDCSEQEMAACSVVQRAAELFSGDRAPDGSRAAKAYEPQQIRTSAGQNFWSEGKRCSKRMQKCTMGSVFSIVIPLRSVTRSAAHRVTCWTTRRSTSHALAPHRGVQHALSAGNGPCPISTQRVVVRQLGEQGIDYRSLGREEFLKRVWKWKEESGSMITRQMKQIGESCDWSPREVHLVTRIVARGYGSIRPAL